MANSGALLRLAALAAACAFGSVVACVRADEPSDEEGASGGELTVRWSLEGTRDPARCEQLGAAAVDLGIYDASQELDSRVAQPCVTFEVTLELARGEYSAEATLVDDDGTPVSATLTVEDLQVGSDEGIEASIDFPADAML